MNRLHQWLCRSDHWRSTVAQRLPWAIGDTDLGPNVLEIGPGPGLTTDLLRTSVPRLTALEIDASLASSLSSRLKGSNVQVIEGDATRMPFGESEFSGAVSFTMLHHVPSQELQNKVLRGSAPGFEARRFFRRQRQPSELVYEDHSYRRHACSRKSRYLRRATGECGLCSVGGAEELASFPIPCSTANCIPGQNMNRVNQTSCDDSICGGVT